MLEPAVPAGTDVRRQAHEIARERDLVLAGQSPRNPRVIRPVIGADWSRMRRERVHPNGATATFLDVRELADLRRRPDLALAWEVARTHALTIADPDYMLVLADERGRVVHRAGDPAILSMTDSLGFGDGAEMLSRGTNGIRLAARTRRPVQLYAGEHWLSAETRWTCSAVPVHDPDTERVIAVVNTTAHWPTVHSHTLLMLMGVAERVEDALRAGRDRADWGRLRPPPGR